MKKVVLGVLIILGFVSFSFAAVKFGGDFITIGDFKYMSSNYVYNNRPGDPYFGLDNVEFIVNLSPKLELTSDVYGMANIIIQPTTKFKHMAIDSFMISYFHKPSKLKIIPFYRYRVAKFDDPENSIGHLNSWVIASSIMGGNNVLNSKVDNTGFYVDTTSTARAGGIPYIIRPVEFMDGTVVSMPGMGEDTTNLSLVGRDMGGFYAEQRAKTYLWQVFLGAYSIDGSGGNLNLAGALNGKILIASFDGLDVSLGIVGDVYSFNNNGIVDYVDFLNVYRVGGIVPNMPLSQGVKSLLRYGAYLQIDHEIASLYGKFSMINQGELFGGTNGYVKDLTGNGFRASGGLFSSFVPGILLDVRGEYISLTTYTNTNASIPSSRIAVNGKLFGDYILDFGGEIKLLAEGAWVSENFMNILVNLPETYEASDIASQGLETFASGLGVKGGIGLVDLFDLLGIYAIGSFEQYSFTPQEYTFVKKNFNITKMEVRSIIEVKFDILGLEGLSIRGGVRYMSWSDNLRSSYFLYNVYQWTKDLSLSYFSPIASLVYNLNDTTSFEVGYGYPIFGSLLDLDYGLTFDAMSRSFYQVNSIYEGIRSEYVAQNLPRVYVDFKTKF
jgi:hypothetical protein